MRPPLPTFAKRSLGFRNPRPAGWSSARNPPTSRPSALLTRDLDYVAALHAGWNGRRRDRIASKDKTIRYIREVVSLASGNDAYRRWATHLYDLYRTGLVHLRAPRSYTTQSQDPPSLSWFLMLDPVTPATGHVAGPAEHLQLVRAQTKQATSYLPVSIRALLDDYLASVEHFAEALQAECRNDGDELLTRWRQTADALCEPDPSRLQW